MKTEPKVEILLDGAWVDATSVGNGVMARDPIMVRTGRSNWSSRTDSGHASFTLADRDGRWSPDYASGAYYGDFRRNIPVRLGVKSGDPYLGYTGLSADLVSTPNVGGGGGGSPATPTWEDVTESFETAFTTTHDISLPATVDAGDRLILIANGGHNSYAPTSDWAAWTSLLDRSLHTFHRWHILTYYVPDGATATALSGATYQFSTSNSVRSGAQVIRISGARSGTGYTIASTTAAGYGDDPDSPSVTADWGATTNLFISIYTAGGNGATYTTQPTGYTFAADGNPSAQYTIGTAYKASSSATDNPGAWDISVDENWEATTLVIRPVEVTGSAGSLDVEGDLEVRIEFQLHADLYDITDADQPNLRLRLAHRTDGTNGWEWELFNYAGYLHSRFIWYDTSAVAHAYETINFTDRLPFSVLYERTALRFTLDVNNGSSDSTGRFYHSDSIDGTWTQLDDGVTGEGVTDIQVTTAPLKVAGNGADLNHVPITGKTFAFRLYDGIGGTPVADVDFTAQTVGDNSFVDDAGATWTVATGGVITNTRWRFHGELASIPTRWNVDGSDVWAPVEASGLFRRLRQGPRRLESPLRRGILRRATNVTQYWPCEEQGGGYITRFGAAIGTNPIVITNAVPDTGQNTAFVASDPLATFGESIWTATIDTHPETDAWQIRWLQSIPEGFTGDDLHYLHIVTSDMIWHVRYRDDNGGDLEVIAYREGEVEYQTGWISFGATGTNWRMSLSVKQNGANLDVLFVREDPIDGYDLGIDDPAAVAGTAGFVNLIQFNKDSNITTWSVGHITLQSALTDTDTLRNEITAWDGERAADRIARLCLEEGLAFRIQGNPNNSEQMGPQSTATLMELLEECAATDLGILFEPREALAVGYRTFEDMNNQSAQLALDYSAGELGAPPELDRDDQNFANDVTVENASGARARAELADGSVMSVSQPPTGAGRYDASFRVNAQEERLPILAARLLTLSSPDEPRVSKLRLGLHHPTFGATLVANALDARLGDLITIENNLTVALGSTIIRQLIQGTAETIATHEHFIDCLTTPGSPWQTVPYAITDLAAVGGQEANLLTWSEPFNDGAPILGYEIQRSAAGATTGFTQLDLVDPVTAYTDTGASGPVPGVQYWYRVRAVNSAGNAEWSNVVTATAEEVPDPPAAISNLNATAGILKNDLTWSAPSSTETITSYDIQRSIVGATGPWVDVAVDISPTTSYSDTGLVANVEYWYRVRATSSEGDGPWSNVDSGIPTIGISIVGSTEQDETSTATTHSITLPSGIQADDLICIWTSTQSSTSDGAPTATGYTQRYSQGHASSFRPLITLLYKKAVGTESGSSVTLTWGVSCDANSVCVVFRGVHTTTPFDQTEPASTNGGNNPDPPSITTVTNKAWVIAAVCGNRSPSTSTPTISTGYSTAHTQVPDIKSLVITYKEVATAGAENPAAWSWSTIDNHTATVTALRPAGAGSAPGSGTAAPSIPSFTSTLTITAGQNVKSLVEAQPEGAHITLAAGTHTNCENVKLKSNQHIRLATGAILEGSGKGYCFRPLNQSVTGVSIGGDPGGTRPIIRNYGLGTTRQEYGAIMGKTDEPLNLYPTEPDYIYADVDDWFVYHIDFEKNASNAIQQGSNWTIFDCEFHGHTVTGVGGDRIVGGLVHSCLFYWNALSPAGGAFSNGGQIKYTWVNGDVGRTAITPVDRTKAQLIVSNCIFESFDRDGQAGDSRIGVWFDLDCKDCLVEYCTFDDHSSTSLFAEGCNDITFDHNTVRRSNGYGNAFNENFVNGAICFGESTNCVASNNTIYNSSRAMVNRMSNRSGDWYNSNNGSFVNYAWAAGPRYWILATGRGTTPSASAQSNMWTGGNSFTDNVLVNCGRVMINEGTNAGGMSAQGATPNDLVFDGNSYSGSPGIQFFNKSNTALANFAAWQALGYDT